MLDPNNSRPDYADTSMTENGRVSYPIFHIDGYVSASFMIHQSAWELRFLFILHFRIHSLIIPAQRANGWAPEKHYFPLL